ncbi:SPFH domain-containing protein [Nocardiopsis tropica]|jgi:hypothetical protein|uniref:SPFH domain-containing protein n=1 Tax=Nocardiopsis tropica TaxID=109330 RepID=A0ABU7L2B7_9ACTN|nr:SPFH domain-containing protein [Nocardiopsis umidischolae]MEE2055705.1 SPFH domain-containing protein [Nocardiopsis umidischolae]
MTPNRTTTAALATAALALGLTACSVSVDPDEMGLEYNAGLFSSTAFDQCVESGNREYYGPGDEVYVYPGGQRTFTFSGGDEAEMSSETVVTADNLEMTSTGVVTFQLNPDCDVFQQMHELVGTKYEAHEDEGWNEMIRDYVGQPLRRALDDASAEFEWQALYSDDDAKREWESRVGELLVEYVTEMGGGAFFISPTYSTEDGDDLGAPQLTLQRPVPPETVREAMTEAHQVAEQIQTAEAREELADAEAEAMQSLVDLLGPEGAVLYEAIKNGDVDVVALSPGAGVSVTGSGD